MNQVSDEIKAVAAIGTVCLQYSLLELMVAGITWELLGLDFDQGAVVTGGADLVPRINMALGLMEELRTPSHMRKRLRAILKELRDKDLIQRRNQAVHGAHKTTGIVTTFTMLRWSKGTREQDVSVYELHALCHALNRLAKEAAAIAGDAGRWRAKKHGAKDASNSPLSADVLPSLSVTQRLYASAQHLWHRIKG